MGGDESAKIDSTEALLEYIVKDVDHRIDFLVGLGLLSFSCYSVIFATFFGMRDDDTRCAAWSVCAAVGLVCTAIVIYRVTTRERSASSLEWVHTLGTSAAASSASVDSASPTSDRVNQLDFLKLIVNFLAVLYYVYNSRWAKTPGFWQFYKLFVTPWLAPAVALASGLVFSSSAISSKKTLALIVAYFPLQFVYLLMIKWMVLEEHPNDKLAYPKLVDLAATDNPMPWYMVFSNLIRPYAHLWYLWALFAWRLLAPLLMRLKHPVSWAMLFAILSGFFYSDALEVYRTLGYLPYFLAGGVVTRQGWREPLRRLCAATDVKVWAVLMLGLHAGMAGYAEHVDLCHGYFEIQGQGKYVDMKCGKSVVADTDKYWPNMFARLASYPLGLSLTLAVLALMPSEDNFIRKAGERLAGPYTLMMVPYLFLRAYSPLVDDYDSGHSIPLFILQMLWTVALYVPQVHEFGFKYLLYFPLEEAGLLADDAA